MHHQVVRYSVELTVHSLEYKSELAASTIRAVSGKAAEDQKRAESAYKTILSCEADIESFRRGERAYSPSHSKKKDVSVPLEKLAQLTERIAAQTTDIQRELESRESTASREGQASRVSSHIGESFRRL